MNRLSRSVALSAHLAQKGGSVNDNAGEVLVYHSSIGVIVPRFVPLPSMPLNWPALPVTFHTLSILKGRR
jgi:hypothetical protein